MHSFVNLHLCMSMRIGVEFLGATCNGGFHHKIFVSSSLQWTQVDDDGATQLVVEADKIDASVSDFSSGLGFNQVVGCHIF